MFTHKFLFILFLVFPKCFCWIAESVLVSSQIVAVFVEVNFCDVDGAIPFFGVPFVMLLLIEHKLICLYLCCLIKWLYYLCFRNTLSFAGNVDDVVLLDFRYVGSRLSLIHI